MRLCCVLGVLVAALAIDTPPSTEQCGEAQLGDTSLWLQSKEFGFNEACSL